MKDPFFFFLSFSLFLIFFVYRKKKKKANNIIRLHLKNIENRKTTQMFCDLISNNYFNFFHRDFGHLGFANIVLTRIWSSPNH